MRRAGLRCTRKTCSRASGGRAWGEKRLRGTSRDVGGNPRERKSREPWLQDGAPPEGGGCRLDGQP